MCERKLFPKPCPSDAPFTNPAMSTTFKKAGTLLEIASKSTRLVVVFHSFNIFNKIFVFYIVYIECELEKFSCRDWGSLSLQ